MGELQELLADVEAERAEIEAEAEPSTDASGSSAHIPRDP